MTFPRFFEAQMTLHHLWGLNCSPMQRPRAYDRALSLPVRPSEIAGAGRNRMIPLGEAHGIFPRAKLDDMDIYIYIYMVTSCKIDRTCVLWRGPLVSGIDFPLYITLWLFNMMIYLLTILIFHGYVNPTINH